MAKKKTIRKRQDRELLFAREYVANELNGTKAAIAAGYAAKSAHVTASRALKKAKVQKEIERLQNRHAEKLEITKEKVLHELALMAMARMDSYITVTDEGAAFVDLSEIKRRPELAAAIQEIQVDEFVVGSGDDAREVRKTKFKLADKKGSLELLGRNLGLFPTKHEHTGKDGQPIEFKDMTNADIDTRIQALERELGLTATAAVAGGAGATQAGTKATPGAK